MTQADAPGARSVTLPRHITVRELSEALDVTAIDIIKELMKRGVMAAINQSVEYEVAAAVARDLGFEAEPEAHAGGVGDGAAEHGRGAAEHHGRGARAGAGELLALRAALLHEAETRSYIGARDVGCCRRFSLRDPVF